MALVFVGAVCLDNILRVKTYPIEDSEIRIAATLRAAGGNAANAARVIGALRRAEHYASNDSPSILIAAIPDETLDSDTRWALATLSSEGVSTSYAAAVAADGLPTSFIIATPDTRTILHHRGVRELTYEDIVESLRRFAVACGGDSAAPTFDISVLRAAHIHVEGRSILAVDAVLQAWHAASDCAEGVAALSVGSFRRPLVSVELEKSRSDGDVESLLRHADIVFLSAEYLVHHLAVLPAAPDTTAVSALLDTYAARARPHAVVLCTWGAAGAYVRPLCGGIAVLIDAPRLGSPVVDTIGAGDTFLAAFIHTLHGMPALRAAVGQHRSDASGSEPEEALLLHAVRRAVSIASIKCRVHGFGAPLVEAIKQAMLPSAAPEAVAEVPVP